MKTALTLTFLLAFGALAALPPAQAHVAPPRDSEACVTVYDFPDNGYRLCADLEDSSCTVYAYRTTFLGTETDCIVPDAEGSATTAAAVGPPDLSDWPKCAPARPVATVCLSIYWPGCNVLVIWHAIPAQPSCLYRSDPVVAGAAGPGFECMDVYRQTELAGGYWLVQRSSCEAELYHCPDGATPPGPPCQEVQLLELQASGLDCYMVYSRTNVGNDATGHFAVVRRTSCSPPEVYRCPSANAPIDQCEPVANGLLRASAAPGVPDVGLPPMNCYDIYSRREVGPAAVVMTSSCSGHVELCDDNVLRQVDTSCLGAVLPPIYCMPYTRELEAGPLTVEQGGCGNDVEVCDDSVLDGRADVSCVLTPIAASAAPEPACLQVYRETEVGPVRVVSRDSCHSDTYVCGDHSSEWTDLGNPQTDEAKLQMCLRDTLDKYIAST